MAIDDVFLWLHSPYLAIPLTLLLIVGVIVFFVGGKDAANGVVNVVKQGVMQLLGKLTTQAAAAMIKKDN